MCTRARYSQPDDMCVCISVCSVRVFVLRISPSHTHEDAHTHLSHAHIPGPCFCDSGHAFHDTQTQTHAICLPRTHAITHTDSHAHTHIHTRMPHIYPHTRAYANARRTPRCMYKHHTYRLRASQISKYNKIWRQNSQARANFQSNQ